MWLRHFVISHNHKHPSTQFLPQFAQKFSQISYYNIVSLNIASWTIREICQLDIIVCQSLNMDMGVVLKFDVHKGGKLVPMIHKYPISKIKWTSTNGPLGLGQILTITDLFSQNYCFLLLFCFWLKWRWMDESLHFWLNITYVIYTKIWGKEFALMWHKF